MVLILPLSGEGLDVVEQSSCGWSVLEGVCVVGGMVDDGLGEGGAMIGDIVAMWSPTMMLRGRLDAFMMQIEMGKGDGVSAFLLWI